MKHDVGYWEVFGNFEKMFSAKSRDFRYVFGDFGPKISGNTACAIQTCLKENKYQESECQEVLKLI